MIANRKVLKWWEAHAIVYGAMIGPANYCTVTASSIASTQYFKEPWKLQGGYCAK